MSEDSVLFLTNDHSHSLRSQQFGVSYHSTHGALQESRHIFIDAGLRPLLTDERTTLRILEMGLGTGLNALLVRLVARQYPRTSFDYTSYEQYPITSERARDLNYPQLLSVEASDLLQLHDAPWGEAVSLENNFTFTKRHEDFLSIDGRILGDIPEIVSVYAAHHQLHSDLMNLGRFFSPYPKR